MDALQAVLAFAGGMVIVCATIFGGLTLLDWVGAYMSTKEAHERTRRLSVVIATLENEYSLHVDTNQFYTQVAPKSRSHNGIGHGSAYSNVRAITESGEYVNISFKLAPDTDTLSVYQVARQLLPVH